MRLINIPCSILMLSRQYISEIRLKREEIQSFDQYPFSLPAVRHLNVLQLQRKSFRHRNAADIFTIASRYKLTSKDVENPGQTAPCRGCLPVGRQCQT